MADLLLLPPALLEYLTRGETDVLGPLQDSRVSAIKGTPCPRCGSSLHPQLDASRPFSPADPLPRLLANCPECGFKRDERSGIVLDTGSAAKVEDPLPIIKP